MKRAILIMLVACDACSGQRSEFKTYSNGLIYDKSTMRQLAVIVDSLNVRFRACDLSHPYYSLPQGMATLVVIPNDEARRLIEGGIAIDDYKKRYPESIKDDKLWITKTTYTGYQKKKYIEYSGLPYGWNDEPAIRVEHTRSVDKTSGWVVDDDRSRAFYFNNLTRTELPFEYARLIQYVDCMVDTTGYVYFPDAKSDYRQQLDSTSTRSLSKADRLKLLRSQKVVGYCSMDSGPRIHAMMICKLAAETAQWDIFLRSHLDIMNDRFERASDGSYAWEGRKTYLKELEELDIDAIDLLLGTSLRVENVSGNHYYGSISRVGRALSDASDKEGLERRMLRMISNENLDPYNRLLIAYVFSNYSYNFGKESLRAATKQKIDSAVSQLPPFIKEVWKKD